jgi:thymidylate kinase
MGLCIENGILIPFVINTGGSFAEKALLYAEIFNIIKPDAVLYLDVPPEIAIKWKFGENKPKNFREEDHAFIKKTYTKYDDLVNRNVWAKWIRVNGNQKKEKVTKEILDIIKQLEFKVKSYKVCKVKINNLKNLVTL